MKNLKLCQCCDLILSCEETCDEAIEFEKDEQIGYRHKTRPKALGCITTTEQNHWVKAIKNKSSIST